MFSFFVIFVFNNFNKSTMKNYIEKLKKMSNDELLSDFLELNSWSVERDMIDSFVDEMKIACKNEILNRMK